MSDVPAWVWWVGGAIVLVALVFARDQGAGTPTLTATPTAADPAVEATTQAAIGARASAFDTLAAGFFGLRSNVASYQRDVSLGALSASASVATAGLARDAAATAEYYTTRRTALAERGATERTTLEQMGLTTRTAYTTTGAVTINRDTQAGETSRTRVNADTSLSIAGMQTTLAQYLADIQARISADDNRTSLSIAKTQASVERQRNTNSLVGDLVKTLGTIGAFFL